MKKYWLGLLFLLLAPVIVRADGGIFYPPSYPVYETGQKAFIYFHNGIEDLVIQPSYSGGAEDFVWVLPTPSEPQVNKSDKSLFVKLQDLTTVDNDNYPMHDSMSLGTTSTSEKEPVTVIEQKTIDAYNITTLKATDETALSEWMKTNQYKFPEDKNYLLGDYISSGWYFVLAKIRPQAIVDADKALEEGTISPLRFTFKSDKIIYPMKLTKMAMEQTAEIGSTNSNNANVGSESADYRDYTHDFTMLTVYVLSDHRVENSTLTTSWANWLQKADIDSLLSQSTEQNWINSKDKMFLTKVYDTIYSATITDDLVFSKTEKDDVYPKPFYLQDNYLTDIFGSLIVSIIIIYLSPIVLLYFILSLKQKYEHKWLKRGFIIKLLLLIIAPIAGFYIVISGFSNYYQPFYENGDVLGAFIGVGLIEILMLVRMIKDYLKFKKGLGR